MVFFLLTSKDTKQTVLIENKIAERVFSLRLIIPSISVSAVIENVGLTNDGFMEVPKKTENVGWFDLGPIPGERGSAVIAGHIDSIDGSPAVFANLNKLKVGDKLLVEDGYGKSLTFVVIKSHVYAAGHADEVFTQNDKIRLNLVTCDGAWNSAKKSYGERLVVFTEITTTP